MTITTLSLAAVLFAMGNTSRTSPSIIITQATASVQAPPDYLFFALTIASGRGNSAVIGAQDLALLHRRLTALGISDSAVIESRVRTVAERYLKIEVVDKRAYAFILLRYRNPTLKLLEWLSTTADNASKRPLRPGVFIQSSGPWYTQDNCDALAATAKSSALLEAAAAARSLANEAGADLISQVPQSTSALPTSEDSTDTSPYICGSDLPAVPPPQIQTLQFANYVGQFSLSARLRAQWMTVDAVQAPAIDSSCAGSNHQSPVVDTRVLRAGQIRSSVAVDNAAEACFKSFPSVSPTKIAIALAERRIGWLAADVGVAPGAQTEFFDPDTHEMHVEGSFDPPRGFRVRDTTRIIVTASTDLGLPEDAPLLRAEASAVVRVPADTAHVVIRPSVTSTLPADLIVRALSESGVTVDTSKTTAQAVEADVPKPTSDLFLRIHNRLQTIEKVGGIQLNDEVVFANDTCDKGVEAALRAAVTAARKVATDKAASQKLILNGIVAAADVGATPTTYCGPGVIASLGPTFSGSVLEPAQTSVEYEANVAVLYSVDKRVDTILQSWPR